MKIIKRIRDIHTECKIKFELLESEIKDRFKPMVESNGWFFYGRTKKLESFALKIETGRVDNPMAMEDFYACTIVVPTASTISHAERLVQSNYEIKYRRPSNDTKTHKPSSSFAFDDLRLYVSRPALDSGKNPSLEGTIFEIQVKTALQYAWGVATHDLIYKTDTVSWSKERIAFQVKAMLEHAEVAIVEATQLASSTAVSKVDNRTATVIGIIGVLNEVWPRERLPADIKRLAETVFDLLRVCNLDNSHFSEIVAEEKKRLGVLPLDLSPYSFALQSLAHNKRADLERRFNANYTKMKIVIHPGMDLPSWMLRPHPRIINLT